MDIRITLLSLSLLLLLSCKEQAKKHVPDLEQNIESAAMSTTETIFPAWVSLDYVMGTYNPKDNPYMVEIDAKYADQSGRLMHKEAYEAFIKMHDAAQKDGLKFIIKSSLRNFEYQKGIWERKWNGSTLLEGKENAAQSYPDPKDRALAILKYSSMPGSSRHHWGTDIDLNAFTNSYFESGEGLKEFQWLEKNAEKYGFCRPYTKKGTDRDNGYEEEKWHWSYRPIADVCTKYAEEKVTDIMIKGFNGSETAQKIEIVKNYILGISEKCKS